MSFSTKDKVVVVAESVIGGSITVPRVPVAHIRLGGYIVAPSSAGEQSSFVANTNRIKDSNLTHFLRLDSLVLTAGREDGLIAIRELDPVTGAQLSGGDFKSHKFAVTFLSSDSIPGGNSSLVASSDSAGQVLVWTVSVSGHQV